MRRFLSGVSALLALLLCGQVVQAQIPETISYQGQLRQAGGGLVNGFVDITFAIYDDRNAQVPLWSEIHLQVEVMDGRFSVELGSVRPFSIDGLQFDVPYFLGIQVENDSEMSPRLPLTSVGYALNALRAQNADKAQNADRAQDSDRSQNSDRADVADQATVALGVASGSIDLASLDPNVCQDGQIIRKFNGTWLCASLGFDVQLFPPSPNRSPAFPLGSGGIATAFVNCPFGTIIIGGQLNAIVQPGGRITEVGFGHRGLNAGFISYTNPDPYFVALLSIAPQGICVSVDP